MCCLFLWLHGLKDGGVFSLGVIIVGLDLGRQVCVCVCVCVVGGGQHMQMGHHVRSGHD